MKKRRFIVIIIVSLFFFLFGIYLLNQNSDNKFAKFIKDKTPYKIKIFLKDTLFYIPLVIKENKRLKNEVNQLNVKKRSLELKYAYLKNKIEYGTNKKIVLEKEKNKYLLNYFIAPFYSENIINNKKTGYIDLYKNNIILVFGSGKIISIDKFDLINKNILNFKEIKNNLIDLNLFNPEIKWTGVKDIKIFNDTILISITEEIKKECYVTTLLFSKIEVNNLNFQHLFRPDECVDINENIVNAFKYFNGHQTGGRIEIMDNEIFLTVGDYNNWKLPQKKESVFGKILKLDLTSKKYEILSIGHRNQQGLEIIPEENQLISTEHGPKGGDEINLIKLNSSSIENFGWPISSYGEHYDVVPLNSYTKQIAPLNKSHEKYGFVEPIFYFKDGGIGISEIIKNYFSEEKSFLITSLKNKKIYVMKFDKNYKESKILEELDVGERIRDIVYDKKTKNYILYLENTPNILILKKTS